MRWLLAMLPAVLVPGGMALYLYLQGVPLADFEVRSETRTVSCPLIGVDGVSQPVSWNVYRHSSYSPVPEVAVGPAAPGPPGNEESACRLRFSGAPGSPGRDADWRIGHVFADAGAFAGKQVRLRLWLQADRAISLDSASLYLSDGLAVSALAIDAIDTTWREVAVVASPPSDAPTLEIWLRLLVGAGSVRPDEGEIRFLAAVSVDDAPDPR